MKTSFRSLFAALALTASTTAVSVGHAAWQDPISFQLSDRTIDAAQGRTPAPIISAISGSASSVPVISGWQQEPQVDDPSRLTVPPAPRVDTSPDAAARPLGVASNAATLPDEYYRASWCNLGEPINLIDRPAIGLRIGGWQQIGVHTRNDGLFNNREDKLAWHQSWGFIEKDFTTRNGLGVTLRGDMVYGLDAQQFQAFGNEPFGTPSGWDNDWDHGSYGWALPQAYADVHFDQVKLRGGRFLSPFGFETGAAVENFFYSRTFAFTRTQPHTLTGAVADYQVNDTTSVIMGATNGWDTGLDAVEITGLAGFTRKIGGRSFLNYGSSFGDFGVRGTGYFQSLLYAYQATDKLQLALQSDWLTADQSEDYGFIGYAIYRINPCLALGSRFEYWETDPSLGVQQSANSLTGGLNFRPHANVVFRPEVRYDWNTAATTRDDVNLGLDVVITF